MSLPLLTFAAVVQGVLISPEFPVDTPLTAPVAATAPAAAFDGTNTLVVWNTGGTYGALISPAGVVGTPFLISKSGVESAVAFDGTNYLVVMSETLSTLHILTAARVSKAGVVLDTNRISLPVSGGDDTSPAVAFGTTDYLVVWRVSGGVSAIRACRVSTAGVVLETNALTLTTGTNGAANPSVAFDGTRWLTVWDELSLGDRNVYGARVTTAGVVTDTSPLLIAGGVGEQSLPAIAFDGADWLVAFRAFGTSTMLIQAKRFTTALASVGGVLALGTLNNGAIPFPAATFDGTNVVVSFTSDSPAGVYATRVSPAGAVLDSTPVSLSGVVGTASAVAACGSAQSLVVWQGTTVFARRLPTASTPLDVTPLQPAVVPNAETAPSVAFDGTNFFVVWEDGRAGNSDLYAARVTDGGVSLDSSAIAVATGVNAEAEPAVAFNGTNFLVVWSQGTVAAYDVYGRLYTTAGAPVGAAFAIAATAASESTPRVASNGTDFLVVWNSAAVDVRGARVSGAGSVLDSPSLLLSSGHSDTSPTVAFDGTQYKVMWEASGAGLAQRDTWCSQVSPTGTFSAGAMFFPNSGGPRLAIADATHQFVAFSTSAGLGIQRVGTNCTLTTQLGGPALLDTAGSRPSLSFDGTSFLATWDRLGIRASLVNLAGYPAEPVGGLLVASLPPVASPTDTAFATVAAFGSGNFGVFYQENLLRTRIRGRLVGFTYSALGSSCTAANSCATGFCIDGVCCDGFCGGGAADDCQACSVAKGASAEGVCSIISNTHVCRPDAGACDVTEVCDGVSRTCPLDTLVAAAVECRAAAGLCDLAELCTGAAAACPVDGFASAGTSCRAAVSTCDVAEVCDGAAASCPADVLASNGTACSGGVCQAGSCQPDTTDGGTPTDGGVASDAGTADAGAPDAGEPDAGQPLTDGGTTPEADGGTPDSTTKPACGCQAPGSATLPWVTGLLLLAMARRRRGSAL